MVAATREGDRVVFSRWGSLGSARRARLLRGAVRRAGVGSTWRILPEASQDPYLPEFDVAAEEANLISALHDSLQPVQVTEGRIAVNETAMVYDTIYPVSVDDSVYHFVLRFDGALEIYEVSMT